MSSQVTLFHHGISPNPSKVAMLLEGLGVSYNLIKKEFEDGPNGVKHPDFSAINPNGRIPVLIDHTNNDKIVWESGAILLYVAEQFDNSGTFNGKNLDEKAIVWQWLMFQLSGLGPMQGQVNYFKYLHPVKNLDQSVYDRFRNETHRIYGVLEKQLEKQEWIALPDRFTIAGLRVARYGDLTFDGFPHLQAYFDKVAKIPSVEIAYKKLIAAHHGRPYVP
ncbi:hypothetical protein Clacol_003443 [Clathrus columnatus]|uniref:Glutathione S-transferase n=1 Tax=Clathrus columnatus TaxID=1419009 RepID=A0AAV5A874_9AGAM|nr:hypothetical protein Clacol_003443 [Clathrus columnatus]